MNRRGFLKLLTALPFVAPLIPKVLEAVPQSFRVIKHPQPGLSTLTFSGTPVVTSSNAPVGTIYFMNKEHLFVSDGTNWQPINAPLGDQ